MTTRNPLSNLDEDNSATIGEDSDDEKDAALGDSPVENREYISRIQAFLVPAAPSLGVMCVAGVLGLIAVLLVAGSTAEGGSDLVRCLALCTQFCLLSI